MDPHQIVPIDLEKLMRLCQKVSGIRSGRYQVLSGVRCHLAQWGGNSEATQTNPSGDRSMANFFKKALRLLGARPGSDVAESVLLVADSPQSESGSYDRSLEETRCPSVQYQWVYDLTMNNAQELESLTFPSLQKRWQTHPQRGHLGGVVAIVEGQMVGLVLVELLRDRAEIISLFVVHEYRRQGIGSQLLRYIEIPLRKLNYPRICLSYRVSELTQQGLETILWQQDWQPPNTEFFITRSSIEALKQAPWVYQYPLPSEFTIFPWLELTQAEHDRIVERRFYPDRLNPFTEDPRIEPINSLGLRYQGEVIGWTINHRVAPDTIRYSTMFVEPPFQRMGRGFSLLTEAIQRQIDSGIPYATTAVASDNLAMLRCADRYYKPYATYVSESRSSYKMLT